MRVKQLILQTCWEGSFFVCWLNEILRNRDNDLKLYINIWYLIRDQLFIQFCIYLVISKSIYLNHFVWNISIHFQIRNIRARKNCYVIQLAFFTTSSIEEFMNAKNQKRNDRKITEKRRTTRTVVSSQRF